MLPRISLEDAERRQREIDTFKLLLPLAVEIGMPGISRRRG